MAQIGLNQMKMGAGVIYALIIMLMATIQCIETQAEQNTLKEYVRENGNNHIMRSSHSQTQEKSLERDITKVTYDPIYSTRKDNWKGKT